MAALWLFYFRAERRRSCLGRDRYRLETNARDRAGDQRGTSLARSTGMSKILIAFASRHGHSAKIAARIAARLTDARHTVVLYNGLGELDPRALEDADGII